MELLSRKFECLKEIISSMGSLCVAFSGGVDSTFLLGVARDVLGEDVMAVTVESPTYPERELREAVSLAEAMNVRHLVIYSSELEIPGFSENGPERCYFCKRDLFEKLRAIADGYGIRNVADGSNHDDAMDYRPGMRAARELGIKSPLAEAGLAKDEVRRLSKEMGLSTWGKPSQACLSSRIPYGERITEEKLRKIEKAEGFLKSLGFTQCRVRHHDGIARLEFIPEEMGLLDDREMRLEIINALKRMGFSYVTVDLEGYRTGSMNEVFGP